MFHGEHPCDGIAPPHRRIPAMWPYALLTLRQAGRSPSPWVFLGLGTAAGWVGLNLAILALGEPGTQAPAVVLGTSQTFGVLLCFWVLAWLLEEDRRSALRLAADCTGPGPGGRLLGRWAGALVLGALLSTAIAFLLAGLKWPDIHLLIANIEAVALAAAWGILVARGLGGGLAVLAGLLAWILGHLPWGRHAFLEGGAGAAVGALLPGPRAPAGAWSTVGYTSAATGAILMLALALGPRPGTET
jgi:hypothetical protein